MKVTILGSSSATPFLDRHPSSQLLTVNDHLYLIDCGEGTLFRLNQFKIKKNKIQAIFISHLHGDHYYGLMGLLTTMSMHEKTDELTIVCPPRLKEIIEFQCEVSKTVIRFPIRYIECSQVHTVVYSDKNIEVASFPLKHKIDTCGFRFDKKYPERRVLKEKIEELGLTSFDISNIVGGDSIEKNGRLIDFNHISEENTLSKSYCYCTDTRYDASYLSYISQTDLLYHESTFLHSDIQRAEDTKHSTALEAAQVAVHSKAKKLIIGHFSARYVDLTLLLNEAQSVYANAELALEGLSFEI